MSAPAPRWYVVHASRAQLPTQLPAQAPLAAQYLHGVMPRLAPEIRADIRGGRHNSRRVRTALAQVAMALPVHVVPSRSEVERAVRWIESNVGWEN